MPSAASHRLALSQFGSFLSAARAAERINQPEPSTLAMIAAFVPPPGIG
jgi:hypothetical protein